MKKSYLIMTILLCTGCTQVVTAPVYLAGAVATTTIDVADAGYDAVTDDDED